MLCGYLDDPRQWGEPEVIEEDNDPRNDMEKRLEWICSDWADAITNDRHEEWRDLNMMLHGALQALNHCPYRHDDRMAIMALNTLAYQYSLDCIKAGRYEGATN
jgi:hypothetical protein